MKILFYKINSIILFLISIILSFIFNKNLFIQFISNTVIILILFFSIYYIICFFYYKKRIIDIISFGDGLLFPFRNNKLEINFNFFPLNFPGSIFFIKYDIYKKDKKLFSDKKILNNIEKNKFNFNLYIEKHGEYTIRNFNIIINDIFNFTEFSIKLNYSNVIKVSPYFIDEEKFGYPPNNFGDQVIINSLKENSDDFFENRKYYPGDDPRRINWKLFAHIGELQIRELEKIPPRTGEISIIFAPYSENCIEFEFISSLFYTTSFYLLNNNYNLKIYYPGSNNYILLNNNNKKDNKDLDIILFNSDLSFNLNTNINNENFIIFASFSEYKKILENYNIKNSNAFITLFEFNENLNYLLKSFIFIDKYDMLLREIYNKLLKIKRNKNINKIFELIKKLSNNKNISLKTYKVNDDLYKE